MADGDTADDSQRRAADRMAGSERTGYCRLRSGGPPGVRRFVGGAGGRDEGPRSRIGPAGAAPLDQLGRDGRGRRRGPAALSVDTIASRRSAPGTGADVTRGPGGARKAAAGIGLAGHRRAVGPGGMQQFTSSAGRDRARWRRPRREPPCSSAISASGMPALRARRLVEPRQQDLERSRAGPVAAASSATAGGSARCPITRRSPASASAAASRRSSPAWTLSSCQARSTSGTSRSRPWPRSHASTSASANSGLAGVPATGWGKPA